MIALILTGIFIIQLIKLISLIQHKYKLFARKQQKSNSLQQSIDRNDHQRAYYSRFLDDNDSPNLNEID